MAREKDIFLVANYISAPKNRKQTFRKGYMKNDDNVSFNEQVVVTRGLKDRDLTAAIILNLTQQKVMKCRFELGEVNDWETLANYYAKGYPQYMTLLKPAAEEEVAEAEEVTATEYDVDMDKEREDAESVD